MGRKHRRHFRADFRQAGLEEVGTRMTDVEDPATPSLEPGVPRRVLFVDDRKDRYETLCKERPNDQIIWADCAAVAVAYLVDDARHPLAERYVEIHLDFNMPGEADGLSVVHALGCLLDYYADAKVICHSTMEFRREEMRFNLLRYRFHRDSIDASTCFDDVPGRRPKYQPMRHFRNSHIRDFRASAADKPWWETHGTAEWDDKLQCWRYPVHEVKTVTYKPIKYTKQAALSPGQADGEVKIINAEVVEDEVSSKPRFGTFEYWKSLAGTKLGGYRDTTGD